jgi:hypothetical protein
MAKKDKINKAIFEVTSACPILKGPIRLLENTFNYHISKHPEVASDSNALLKAATNPSYVAESKPGPGGRHTGNLVLVDEASTLNTSSLHVFVEQKGDVNEISSAMYSKKYHGKILWKAGKNTGGSDVES